MDSWINNLVDGGVQCWGCPVFDRLFMVVSNAAAAMYRQFSLMCVLIFVIVTAFFVLNTVWKNIRGGVTDPFYQKSMRPWLINSAIVFAMLGLGVMLPRFITTITFEPVADVTRVYTQSMINTDDDIVNQKVTYKSIPMDDTGFYRPALRDKIIMLMKTTVTQFQAYIKLGIAVMDSAFSWAALGSVGALIKHIMIFAMGLYLAFNFFKLFIRFCFYFVDIIVAMTFFAFFFPLSLVMFVFKGTDAPGWVSKVGGNFGANQFKTLVNAIVTLASAILTYTVIMVIIAKFFAGDGTSTAELMDMITSGSVTAAALSDDNLAAMTLAGCVVLVYVINYLADNIKQVADKVMKAFDVSTENKLSEELATDALKVTENIAKTTTDIGKKILGIETKKEEKKDEKKEEKK